MLTVGKTHVPQTHVYKPILPLVQGEDQEKAGSPDRTDLVCLPPFPF